MSESVLKQEVPAIPWDMPTADRDVYMLIAAKSPEGRALLEDLFKKYADLLFVSIQTVDGMREEIKKLTLLSDSQLANQERLTEELACLRKAADRICCPDGSETLDQALNELKKFIGTLAVTLKCPGNYLGIELATKRISAELTQAREEIKRGPCCREPWCEGECTCEICAPDLALRDELATERANQERLVGERYQRGFNDCREKAMRVVDEHDGFLSRIEDLKP